ncbi:mannitol 1-phosphate dehydrogenase [Seiridium cupressi]
MAVDNPEVAIIGGGLCGLALAIALEKRNISYTIYELQSSFSEIGAGLNVAPNAIAAFNLIEPGLGDVVMALSTRNSPDPDIWMVNRLGAPTDRFPDAHPAAHIMAPGVGHTAVGRYELLNLLASKIDQSRARFVKKLISVVQHESGAELSFEDGTTDTAGIVIACDGIHSAVRKSVLGQQHPSAEPKFTGIAGYRAVFTMDKLIEALGPEIPRTSCIWSGPGGYVTMYTIEGGNKVNVGLWRNKEEFRERLAKERWVLKNQKQALLDDFKEWGPAMQKIMGMMGEETQLWTSHQHDTQLDDYFKGRICLIGDAAHSMGPHWGQGASQVMEDAYVMAEVLAQIKAGTNDGIGLNRKIEAAFMAWQEVRKPQFEWLVRASHEAFDWWAGFWRSDLTEVDIEERQKDAAIRLGRIWNANIGRQGEVAKFAMCRLLKREISEPDLQ